MGRSFANFNPLIIFPIFILCAFSLALIHSINPDLFWLQVGYMVIGFIVFILFSSVDYRIYAQIWPLVYATTLIFLAMSFFGPLVRGANRWLEIGWFRIQPSEIIKPFVLLVQVTFLTRPRLRLYHFFSFLVLSGVIVFIVFRQPDLGNTLIYLGTMLGLLFVSSVPLAFFAALICLGLLILPTSWYLLRDYQRLRIISFFNPQLDKTGTGYNAIQAIIAIGSGGFWGRGLGKGPQSHLRFLPENHTDFIFASLSEELGFIGASLVIMTYFFLLFQLFLIYRRSQTAFAQVFILGFIIQLFLEVVINIGMNLGLMPITGVTLPLVSYGGSSIIATFISLGIIHSISSEEKRETRAVAIG